MPITRDGIPGLQVKSPLLVWSFLRQFSFPASKYFFGKTEKAMPYIIVDLEEKNIAIVKIFNIDL